MTSNSTSPQTATLLAGVPSDNKAVYHRIRFSAHDPAVWVRFHDGKTALIIRDVELQRARKAVRVDEVSVPADWTPAGGLSGDREIATAQAAAEFLRCRDIKRVISDRSLPFIFAAEMKRAGIECECDPDLGVRDRRSKDAQEVAFLQKAQSVTEAAIQMACELIARANADKDGVLRDPRDAASPLTSERVKAAIDIFLAERGFSSDGHIVAGGPASADCHFDGAGPLRTAQPVIIDVFPCDRSSGYYGDCTRCVVHGDIPDEVARMHATVIAAKNAGIAATRAGVTGEEVHNATARVITDAGYNLGFPPENAPAGYCSMPHGTGHGLGLSLKEPPLLDRLGPELIVGDAVTVEPGLYALGIGGIRIEDLVIVRKNMCENLNRLPEGLTWR
ncbi:MAG: aminopeptidase P family protein [Phycisphaerales bacterium]|nr:aminopeptidase P family protein [Phycisphaerales bacterium]